jgi:DNA-binding HxlR family transcriptional regulator
MSSNDIFEAISHPLRVEILKLLAKKPMRFADIKRELEIESSGLLDFHLKKLDNLISVDNEGFYVLSEKGFAALQAIDTISKYGWQKRAYYLNIALAIIINLFTLILDIKWLPLTISVSIIWIAFYSYWTLVKRRIRLRRQ